MEVEVSIFKARDSRTKWQIVLIGGVQSEKATFLNIPGGLGIKNLPVFSIRMSSPKAYIKESSFTLVDCTEIYSGLRKECLFPTFVFQ